jgi:hypothetical protein
MASNKNQHYVPRCYLKAFTLNRANKAINLFNIDAERLIINAPVKNQCSSDYFYGKDAALEKALQATEGAYSTCAARVQAAGYQITDSDKTFLRRFWLLQYLRTDAASRRVTEMSSGMLKRAGADHLEFKLEMKDAVQIAMRAYVDEIQIIDDLKVCLFRNRTEVEFVASDDPAILTNRWQLSARHRKGRSFGINSAGALALLPISPSTLLCAYDGDVYSIEHDNGWVNLSRTQDVDALNEHQILNCRANVFISDVNGFPHYRSQHDRVKHRRLAQKYRFNYAVLDREADGVARYRVVERDPEEHEEAIIHTEFLCSTPSAWPSQMALRHKSSAFTNGTGLGYIRRSEAQRRGLHRFRRERADL